MMKLRKSKLMKCSLFSEVVGVRSKYEVCVDRGCMDAEKRSKMSCETVNFIYPAADVLACH